MSAFYSDLAPWWPLISPVEDYQEEANTFRRIIEERIPSARTMLELGSGGGHNAYYLKQRFSLTLSDLSRSMLDVSARINPECEHIVGDMRALDLGRTFDVVFAHDAIDYMGTEADLEAAIVTAHRHLVPSGLVVLVPDHVRERYRPGTDCGGTDGEGGRAIRYLEWSGDESSDGTTITTHYSFLVREADGDVRCLHETHQLGLFPEATWVQLLERSGFAVQVMEEPTDEERTPRRIFLGRKSA